MPPNRYSLIWGFGLAVFQSSLIPAVANDTMAELSIGGITFLKTTAVSMESEELFISPADVRVKYRFRNITSEPVNATVAFPLPTIDLADPDSNIAIPASDPFNFVGFRTRIDGKFVTFGIEQRAMLAGKDVTSLVKTAGLPVMLLGAPQQQKLASVSGGAKAQLIDAGLLVANGAAPSGEVTYIPGWTVETSFMRNQLFPPGKEVVVEHTYKTSLGGSVDTQLRKALRSDAETARYRTDYCVDDVFLASLDKLAGSSPDNRNRVQERRISYTLVTGANWAGPIKRFKLTIDKGRANRLVSFCFDKVKKISATRFQVDLTDYVPAQNLKILLLGKSW